MNSSNKEKDIVVVGAGLAGLTAACYLARAGRKVSVFEKASIIGGRGTSSDHEGYQFNRGIHAIYAGGSMTEILRELGIAYTGGTPKSVHVLHGGRVSRAPISPIGLLTSRFFSFRDKIELGRLFRSIARMSPETFANISVQQWLKSYVHRPKVMAFMTANAWTFVYSSALDQVSAEVFLRKLKLSLKHPILYVDGGWQTIVEGLRKTAEGEGASIFTGKSIVAIQEMDGEACGVCLESGEFIAASAVILAVSPNEAVRLMSKGGSSSFRNIVESLTPARVACLDVALTQLPNPKCVVVQDLDHPKFMSVQSLYSRVAPKDGALIYTFKQLDPNQQTEPHQDELELEEFLDVTQPGWRKVLVKRQFLPRIEVIGMLPTAMKGGYSGRPGPKMPDVPNLFVAGDWVGPGFLSDASFSSAREAARIILNVEQGQL
jgi:phytoene dehydrogenase-like protein